MTLLAPLALLIGLLLRALDGRARRQHPLRHPELPLLALLAEAAFLRTPYPVLGEALAYALVLAWLHLHRGAPWHTPLLLGTVLNALAVFVQGKGRMPVDPSLVEGLGLPPPEGVHALAPAFPLGDWIPLLGRAVSPGDIAILIGLVVLAKAARVEGEGGREEEGGGRRSKDQEAGWR